MTDDELLIRVGRIEAAVAAIASHVFKTEVSLGAENSMEFARMCWGKPCEKRMDDHASAFNEAHAGAHGDPKKAVAAIHAAADDIEKAHAQNAHGGKFDDHVKSIAPTLRRAAKDYEGAKSSTDKAQAAKMAFTGIRDAEAAFKRSKSQELGAEDDVEELGAEGSMEFGRMCWGRPCGDGDKPTGSSTEEIEGHGKARHLQRADGSVEVSMEHGLPTGAMKKIANAHGVDVSHEKGLGGVRESSFHGDKEKVHNAMRAAMAAAEKSNVVRRIN